MMSALTGGRRTLLAGALGAVALLGLPGCEEKTEYSYVKVTVKIAPSANEDFLRSIASCGVNVLDSEGNILDFSSINCPEGQVRNHDLGVVDWSTAEPAGRVKLVVILKNRATQEIGKGTSRELTIVKNGTVTDSMQVDPLPDPMMPTGDAGTTTDAL